MLAEGLTHPDRLRVVGTAALADIEFVNGAIASLGSWFSFGPVVETTPDEVQTAFNSLLKSHFVFARTVVPQIRAVGKYITRNGAGSEAPVPNSSALHV